MPKGVKESWDRMSAYYDPFTKKYTRIYTAIVEDMKTRMDPEKKLLEIGTATGILSLMLADHMREIRAVDYSDKMIYIAREKAVKEQKSNISFEVEDVFSLPYEEGSFDYILIANVLHIIPEPVRALKEMSRVLKPGGILFAPTFTHKESRKAAFFSFFAGFIGFKAYSKWTPEGYGSFLEENGFHILHRQVFNSSFPEAYMVCTK